mgnify:FL=1
MNQLPSELRDMFDSVYEGAKACKLTDIAEHDEFTTKLRMCGAMWQTKILRKPTTVFYVLLVDKPVRDYGSCDRCGGKLIDISWCESCGDMGWHEEFSAMQGYWE